VQEHFMSESEVRDARGRFVKGYPGGPGRSRNPVAAAIGELDRLGIEVARRLIGVVAEQGLQGNLRAVEMVLQRVWPVRRNRPVEIVEPEQERDDEPYTIGEHSAVAATMLEGADCAAGRPGRRARAEVVAGTDGGGREHQRHHFLCPREMVKMEKNEKNG
jgi:hypothetical protein